VESSCIFLKIRKIAFWSILLAFAACQPSGDPEQGLEFSAQQIRQTKTWTQRAARELDLALRDSINGSEHTTNPRYSGWLDSLRLADVLVKTAQDRIETDIVVLERLVAGKSSKEAAKIIKGYWENEDRINTLYKHTSDAFALLSTSTNDSSMQPLASTLLYWQTLSKQKSKAAQWAGLRGASLELDIAYLNWLEGFRQHFGLPPYPERMLKLVVSPESRHLLAGETFSAKAWFSSVVDIPLPAFRGRGISTDSAWAEEAYIKLPAGTDSMPGSRSWYQQYEVEASFFNDAGTQQQFQVRDSFQVSRPAVRLSGQIPVYLNCRHLLAIDVPLLGMDFDPIFKASGGTIKKENDSALFTVEPIEKRLGLKVYQYSNQASVLLDTFSFQCMAPPRPQIILLVNGKPYQDLTAIPRKSRLVLQVLPAPDFALLFPEDAEYGLEAAEVLIQQRPDAPPRSILKFSGRGRSGEQGVPILLDEAPVPLPPGTLLYIRAEGIFRNNYEGKNIPDLRFSERERMVSVVLR
jgi:hypothetical protein